MRWTERSAAGCVGSVFARTSADVTESFMQVESRVVLSFTLSFLAWIVWPCHRLQVNGKGADNQAPHERTPHETAQRDKALSRPTPRQRRKQSHQRQQRRCVCVCVVVRSAGRSVHEERNDGDCGVVFSAWTLPTPMCLDPRGSLWKRTNGSNCVSVGGEGHWQETATRLAVEFPVFVLIRLLSPLSRTFLVSLSLSALSSHLSLSIDSLGTGPELELTNSS